MAQRREEGERPPLALIVAANVFRLRKARDLTQEKLAYAAGVSREVVRRLEGSRDDLEGLGGLRLSTIEGLAAALGVEPARLLEWDPEATRVYLQRKARLSHLVAVG
jgi:transcriptional regulator with XRE-family HTH domain